MQVKQLIPELLIVMGSNISYMYFVSDVTSLATKNYVFWTMAKSSISHTYTILVGRWTHYMQLYLRSTAEHWSRTQFKKLSCKETGF